MKKTIAIILAFTLSILACACAKTPQASVEVQTETETVTQAETEAVTETVAEVIPEPETETEPAVSALEPPAVLAYKRNQNKGFFVEHDGKIYYRMPNGDAMKESALFGEYMSGFCGSSEIKCYDPLYDKTEFFRNSLGWGEFYVTGNDLVAQEKDFPNDIEVDELMFIDFDTNKGVIWGDFGSVILAITDDYVIYEDDDWQNDESVVYCFNIKEDSTCRLGKMNGFEYSSYPGIMQQFYMDGNDIWFSMVDYEGTGHFYADANMYHADASKENSLECTRFDEIPELFEGIIPQDFTEFYNRAPGFVIRDGKPLLTFGEPATAEIDYNTGELVYYDDDGRRIPVMNGYETFESDVEGTRIHVELVEFVDQKIYLVRNEEWRDEESDIGWREAYVRKFTYVVMVDPITGEETIIDFAQMPFEE